MAKNTLSSLTMEKKQSKLFSLGLNFNSFLLLVFVFMNMLSCGSSYKKTDQSILTSFPKVKSSLQRQKATDASLMKVYIEVVPALVDRGEYQLEIKYNDKVIPHFLEDASFPERRVAFFGVPYLIEAEKDSIEVTLKNKSGASIVERHEFQITQNKYRSEKLSVDPSRVTPDKKAQERISNESKIVREIYSRLTPQRFWKSGFQNPMSSVITSPFGNKRLFNGQLKSYHNGVDFRAAIGTPFYASENGVVVLARDLYFTGNTVILDHGFGLFTLYGHLDKFEVKENDFVEKGKRLGLTGATGRVSGPHLHWSVMILGERINPLSLSEHGQLKVYQQLASE